jgi:hypothetical protein
MIYARLEPWLSGRGVRVAGVGVVVVLFALLIGSTGSVAAQSAPNCSNVNYDGTGSDANPYEVGNVDQLQCIEEKGLSADYIQVSDIDASETSSWNNGDGFDPIGNLSNNFTGTFDGAGHTVSGLTIDRGSTEYVGLFGFVGSGGRLENVGVKNADMTGAARVGGLVGSNDGNIAESYATGEVSGTSDVVGALVGGNDGNVERSYATGNVSGAFFVGGLAGGNGGNVTNSYATGDVNGNDLVGGLVGNNNGPVNQSYATGDVEASFGRVGGLVGNDGGSGTVTESYWDTESTGQSTSAGGTGLNTSEMIGSAAVGNMTGFNFQNTWETVTDPDDYPILRQSGIDCSNVNYNGAGTSSNPYEVGNLNQLQCINEQGLSANYTQVSDINASGTSGWNNGKGFVPIANDLDSSPFGGFQGIKFTGTFNGTSYDISDLYIDRRSTEYVGLFGFVDSGSLENVTVESVDITGDDIVGGLVGRNNAGTVAGSYATGDVSGVDIVGGLIGDSEGNVTNSYANVSVPGESIVGGLIGQNGGTVRESYATGDINGILDNVGGLIGQNGGTVRESYANGSVNGGNEAGGLVGDNAGGLVRESYATGSVSGFRAVGGLVGFNFRGTVNESYATGEVSGNNRVGGLAGVNDGTAEDSYWDEIATGQTAAVGSSFVGTENNLVGFSIDTNNDGRADEMRGPAAETNMSALDFTSTWETVTDPDDYPVLAWQVDTQLFTQPLIDRFSAPPTNIPKSNEGFDNTLYEDLDGDGSGKDVTQTVAVFGQLIRGNSLNGDAPDGGLTDEQARALNWNQGSPETEVTPADMVSLFGKQIRAD